MVLTAPEWLYAIWAVPAIALVFLFAAWRRRLALARFLGEAKQHAGAGTASALKRRAKGICAILAVAFIAIALARPGVDPKPQKVKRTGRDVVILLDVSRSMLAQDLKPSRLERAKILIRDLLDGAQGDRVGIIAFAGTAAIRCPLTTDYSFARLSLESLTPDTIPVGGTHIGDAIRLALDQVFPEGDDRYRDIVLITDGEDHESMPIDAARSAGARGIRLIAIGLGSELEGAAVPADTAGAGGGVGPMRYDGKEVRSRLDSRSLRDIADASREGVFLNVGTGTIQMDKIYRTLVDRAEKRELDSTERMKYTELFQIALAAALALLAIEMLIGERRKHGIV